MAKPKRPLGAVDQVLQILAQEEAEREAERARRVAARLAAKGRIVGPMTKLLRAALKAAPSLNAVEKATDVKRQSLALFMRGEQTSLRSEAADKLAAYFGIVCSMPASKAKKKGG